MSSEFFIYLYETSTAFFLFAFFFSQQSAYFSHRSANHLFETYNFSCEFFLLLCCYFHIELLYSSIYVNVFSEVTQQLTQFSLIGFIDVYTLFNHRNGYAHDIHSSNGKYFQVCLLPIDNDVVT